MSENTVIEEIGQEVWEHLDGPEGVRRRSEPLTSDFQIEEDEISYHPEAPSVLIGEINSTLGVMQQNLEDSASFSENEARRKAYLEGLCFSYAVEEAAKIPVDINNLEFDQEDYIGFIDQAIEAFGDSTDLEGSEFYSQFGQGMKDARNAIDGSLETESEDLYDLIPGYQAEA